MTERSWCTTSPSTTRCTPSSRSESARRASGGKFLEWNDRGTRGLSHRHSEILLDAFDSGGMGCGDRARRGRGGRAPGAFSHAAEQEDLNQEFDFAGMNQRFAQLRSGEAEPEKEKEHV
jgi:hypothetical protein